MWKDITPPASWVIEAASPSKLVEENRHVEEILQYDDGDL